jgi:NAD(P)-dependent dehydrogenase (short-subunit alcohol dehydrogenase family)
MKLDSSISAVVTGGASGLGEATVRALVAQGVKVAIFDLQAEKGEALAKELGGVFCEVNVTDDASVDAGFAKSRAAIGQERILVNCAGTGNAIKTASRSKEDGSIKHFPLDAFNWIVQINLVGTFRCIAKSAAGMMTLPAMEDGERGAIVNTASVAAEDGQMGQAAYSASKGGVVGMTLPIARDLASENIRVNTILPGIFDTPLLAGGPPALMCTLPGRKGTSLSFTPIGPMPGPPPPCGIAKVLCKFKWQTSAPIEPGLVKPTCAFILAPSIYTCPPLS